MNRFRKIIRWLLGAAALLTAALVVLLIVVPRLVNLEAVRAALISELSQKIGGDLQFQKISLALLPRPRLELGDGRLAVPQGLEASWRTLSVSVRLLPLLRGRLRINTVYADQPVLLLPVSADASAQADGGRQDSALKRVVAKVQPLAAGLAALGEATLVVERGRLTVGATDRFRLDFDDLDARVQIARGHCRTTLRARTDSCEKIELQADFDLQALTGRGRIDLEGIRPQRLLQGILPAGASWIGESLASLRIEFNLDGAGALDATLEGSLPQLTILRGNRSLSIEGQNLKAGFHRDGRQFAIVLSRLSLLQPKLELAGRFRRAEDSGQMTLELKAADLNVSQTRRAALQLAGDVPVLQNIFDIVRDGRLPALDFVARGRSADEIFNLRNMTLTARLLEGRIAVPGLRPALEAVDAEVQIAASMLTAEHISARYENSSASDGSMRLGLSGPAAPFHLDVGLSADLGGLMPVLRQVVTNKRFAAQMEGIAVSGGRARGRLILGETLNRIVPTVKVADFTLNARVAPVSAPLALSGSGLAYSGTGLTTDRIEGRLKNSRLSLKSVALDWRQALRLKIAAGAGELELDELRTELAAVKALQRVFQGLRSLSGGVAISNLRFKGAPASFAGWDFQVDGRMQNVRVQADRLPAPLSVSRAGFSLTRQNLTLSQVQAAMMDIAGTGSGRLTGDLTGIESADLNLQATVGPDGDRWLQQQVRIPSAFILRAPLVLENGRLRFQRKGGTTFYGDLQLGNDLRLTADVVVKPGLVEIRRLAVRDGAATADFALRLARGGQVRLGFKGELQKGMLDKLLAENRILDGWIKGDMQLQYAAGRPMDAVLTGNLNAKDVTLLQRFHLPLVIEDLAVTGAAHRIDLSAAMLMEKQNRLKLTGVVDHSSAGIRCNGDLSADEIDIDRWAAVLKGGRGGAGKTRPDTFWNFPLQGLVRLNSPRLTYGRYDWRDLRAVVTLQPEKITVTVEDARICGISTPGTLTFRPQEISLAFGPSAQQQEIETTTSCLLHEKAKAEGRFDLSGEFAARGPAAGLRQALSGKFVYKGGKGRFYSGVQLQTIDAILAVLNVTEVFRGKLPQLGRDGFGFNSLEAKGKIRGSQLVLEELVLDGLTMTLAAKGVYDLADGKVNMTVLVAPLKTVDAIIKLIPLVRDILGGSLISVPVSVKGDLQKPTITILPPEAVGEGLLGVVKRTLQLPVKIIEPLVPGEKGNSGAAPQ